MVVGDFLEEIDTLIVGSGPGGYVAAIRAAQLGQKVTIVEKEKSLGGVCLNVGCIPSKALIHAGHQANQMKNSNDIGIIADNVNVDFSKVQEWKQSVVKKLTGGVESLMKGNKVEVIKGEAYFSDDKTVRVTKDEYTTQTYKFNNCIIATGSRPNELPNVKWSERVISSTEALALNEIPKRLVVIGGGYIGIELGTAYANFGTEVVILESEKQILLGFEKQLSAPVSTGLKKKRNVEVLTHASIQSVEEQEERIIVTAEINGDTKTFNSNYVLVTAGRKPNTDKIGLEQTGVELDDKGLIKVDDQCKTSIDHLYAIGDVIAGPALAHKASYEGKVAAEAINGEPAKLDYIAIPSIVFSDPELASVGYTEKEAKEDGFDVNISNFSMAANGRALSLNESDGFLKLVTRKEDDLVLGAQIVGPSASEMIAELGFAIEVGMTAEDIALTIHAHPTMSEAAMEAAEIAIGTPIHAVK
ncbi:dihydrolipoyl dehydrogenase [Salicibibacter cibarius]|uniref:Dihydrolipoyl dehydrogenase n=1 Tax=Salicibibacter cibarius TaxID=2743000 RepID=A0A7T6Z6K9_9BACI|nr:dihydrolipoyl dehydrogenase [Salicibibacter cibarius]QQK77767.1 dihydrolipoyl dehydrogenase [Salicibibacter cibarius]